MLDSQTMENAERRRHMRLPTRQSAELFLGSAQANHVCMVLDRSSSGVQVDLGETMDLPNTNDYPIQQPGVAACPPLLGRGHQSRDGVYRRPKPRRDRRGRRN